jgi:hypothetical protein
MPEDVRAAIDGIAGSPVVEAVNLDGGFSPGPAARCTLADGRVVFVKAAGLGLNALTMLLCLSSSNFGRWWQWFDRTGMRHSGCEARLL